ncbi:MAG: nucleoside recognition protein [Negativicutes bacterium]|nr:nucleoside recognition protein [Negativicutes bacterium]
MINWIWMGLMVIGIVTAMYQELMFHNGALDKITKAAVTSANTAVELSIGLVGVMALWLGIMAIAEQAGLVQIFGKMLRPIMVRLFPDVPPEHPAMGAMVMNMAANVLGLGNAATPLGLKAMQELQSLNPHKNVATNAMVMFLALNTSSVQLVAATVIALRVAAGSTNPTSIIGPTLVATVIGTVFAIVITKIFEKLPMFRINPELEAREEAEEAAKSV